MFVLGLWWCSIRRDKEEEEERKQEEKERERGRGGGFEKITRRVKRKGVSETKENK